MIKARMIDLSVYVLAFIIAGVFFLAMQAGYLIAWIYLQKHIGWFAIIFGVPTFGGAPWEIHFVNIIMWSWPGAVVAFFVLKLSRRKPRFLMAGLGFIIALTVVLVCAFMHLSDLLSIDSARLLAVLLVFLFGYFYVDKFVYRKAISVFAK